MSEDFSLGSVQVALTPQQRFEEYLQLHGKRFTQQRRVLIDVVFSQHEHFDAEELLATLAQTAGQGKVSRPTVYRGLSELVEAGLLKKMVLDGRAVYEHDYGYPQHDHLYCESCTQLIEFHSEAFEQIRDAVAAEHNFRITGHRLIISGACSDCCKKRRRKKSPLDLV